MPMANAPYALPWAISLRSRLVPSWAAEILTQPRASSTVTTSGFSFFSTPLARAVSRIFRARSRVRSVMGFPFHLSFRDAPLRRGPGIHNHDRRIWIPGSRHRAALRADLLARPGMTGWGTYAVEAHRQHARDVQRCTLSA